MKATLMRVLWPCEVILSGMMAREKPSGREIDSFDLCTSRRAFTIFECEIFGSAAR